MKSGFKAEKLAFEPAFWIFAVKPDGFKWKKSSHNTARLEDSPGLNPPLAADLAVLNHKNTDLNPLDISPTLIKAVFIASRILIVVLVEIRGIMNALISTALPQGGVH